MVDPIIIVVIVVIFRAVRVRVCRGDAVVTTPRARAGVERSARLAQSRDDDDDDDDLEGYIYIGERRRRR